MIRLDGPLSCLEQIYLLLIKVIFFVLFKVKSKAIVCSYIIMARALKVSANKATLFLR